MPLIYMFYNCFNYEKPRKLFCSSTSVNRDVNQDPGWEKWNSSSDQKSK